jgi:hypothetical protein
MSQNRLFKKTLAPYHRAAPTAESFLSAICQVLPRGLTTQHVPAP